jgi:hypothetical protein
MIPRAAETIITACFPLAEAPVYATAERGWTESRNSLTVEPHPAADVADRAWPDADVPIIAA